MLDQLHLETLELVNEELKGVEVSIAVRWSACSKLPIIESIGDVIITYDCYDCVEIIYNKITSETVDYQRISHTCRIFW